MRIQVRHESRYSYQHPVSSALQLIRLQPRSHDGQFVRRWHVEIDADARIDRSEDAFGNIVHLVFIEGPVDDVRILIDGEVDTVDVQGMARGTVERQSERLFLRNTPLTQPSPGIRTFAMEMAAREDGDRLASLHHIMAEIHATFRFDTAVTDAATAAAEAFNKRHGVCQDFAHVFIAAARSIGLPARYVSGYYLRSDTPEQEAGHAWAEAWLDGIGWVGFDPANGVCVTDRYVRVAIGCDYLEAAPIRGTRHGGSEEALKVAIEVQQGRAIING